MADKLTIRDIAHLAGVSKATVSRVLNNRPGVNPAIRERVLRVVDEHGFVPDPVAVHLAGERSDERPERNHGLLSVFPAHFLWGASTSAYQIEGATAEDGRGPSIWDTFASRPGAIARGDSAEIAADHYHRMPEDVALMAALNLNAYRFSLSWPRILPDGTGQVNTRGLDFYDRLVDTLLAHHICPVATLYHWDLPQALQERGGWQARETAFAFADYAEVVARRLGDRIRWWITHNEPWCSAYNGYGIGIHAPGLRDMQAAVQVAHHLLLAHGLAVPRLRHITRTQASIGIVLNLVPVFPANEQLETQQAVERADRLYNRWFLDPLFRRSYPEGLFADLAVAPPDIGHTDMDCIAAPLDFLGVNYYSRALVRAPRGDWPASPAYEQVVPVPEATYTGMAWEIYPRGLEEVLVRVHREYAPRSVLVAENGASFTEQWDGRKDIADLRRIQYLQDHLHALENALRQGVPLRGYFVWSLLDNFEWIDGYSQRFGLIYVDYATQRRIIKESGRWYATFIAAHQHAHGGW